MLCVLTFLSFTSFTRQKTDSVLRQCSLERALSSASDAMASNAAELSEAAAEAVDGVTDRLQQLVASTSSSECVI